MRLTTGHYTQDKHKTLIRSSSPSTQFPFNTSMQSLTTWSEKNVSWTQVAKSSMSEHACHKIGMAYDPAIKINMQSANGKVNESLELTCNVPFRIGTIIIYLQVHVIQMPAYNVLLGQPFDTLTENVIHNFSNQDQTITIQDPNSRKRVTIPTFSKVCQPKEKNF